VGTLKFFWIIGLIYSTVLLTVSFFVLFAIRKIDSKNLKAFGYAVVMLLWLSAAFVFFNGIYLSSRSFVRSMPGGYRPGSGGNQVPGQFPPQGTRPR